MAQAKPVTLYCISAFKLEGKHIAVGTVINDVEPELAKELTGAGRTRLATADDGKKAAKATAEA